MVLVILNDSIADQSDCDTCTVTHPEPTSSNGEDLHLQPVRSGRLPTGDQCHSGCHLLHCELVQSYLSMTLYGQFNCLYFLYPNSAVLVNDLYCTVMSTVVILLLTEGKSYVLQ